MFCRHKKYDFDVLHLQDNLKTRSVQGSVIVLFSQILRVIFKTGGVMVLARLLEPEDFGLVAMAMAFVLFGYTLKDAQLTAATVQRPHITHEQVSVLFWVNTGLGVLICILLALAAPFIAQFYNNPRLLLVVIALGGGIVIDGLGVQHGALLKRQMRYFEISMINFFAMAFSVLLAIGMAWMGMGYWSLVALTISQSLVLLLGSWLITGWYPGWPSDFRSAVPLLKFGWTLTLAQLIGEIRKSCVNALLGYVKGPIVLGYYSRAQMLFELPIQQLTWPLSSLAVSAMSRAVGDPARYRRAYLAGIEQLSFVMVPIFAVLIVYAHESVLLFLGEKWNHVVPIFVILAFNGFVVPFLVSSYWLFVSQNRSVDYLTFQLAGTIIFILLLAIGIIWGGEGVALAVTASNYLQLPLLAWLVGRSGPVRASDFFSVLVFPLQTALVSIFLLLGLNYFVHISSPALNLLFGILVVMIICCLMLYLLPKGRVMKNILLNSYQHLRNKTLL